MKVEVDDEPIEQPGEASARSPIEAVAEASTPSLFQQAQPEEEVMYRVSLMLYSLASSDCISDHLDE